MPRHVAPKDERVHGPYGDTVVPPPNPAAEGGEQQASNRPNVQLYIKKIKEPLNLTRIRRKGCSGFPCQQGFLCDFCLLRPEWTAEARVGALTEEVRELKSAVNVLKQQEADVETLRRAEKMVAGKHWSAMEEGRLATIGSLVEDSKARLEVLHATRSRVAAETVRDGVLDRLSALQQATDTKDRELSECNTRIDALQQTLSAAQRDLRGVTAELELKRKMIADAFKEKSRAVQGQIRAESTVSMQETELVIKAEQVKALIEKVQQLQDIETERDKFRELAFLRAGLAQGIMEQVGGDIVFAERVRDEHVASMKLLAKENKEVKKSMLEQNHVLSKLRQANTEMRAQKESALAQANAIERRAKKAAAVGRT